MARSRRSGTGDDKSQATITVAKIGIITAFIAVIGVIVTAVFSYLGSRSQVELPVRWTQTAESRLTQAALQAPATTQALPEPSPTPTSTPAEITQNPAIPAATDTSIPTQTAPPAPLARITNFTVNDYVPRFISLMGDYQEPLNGRLWVFVQDPNKLYYPQSMSPCTGESTPTVSGKWEIRIGVGLDLSSGVFNLVLTVADDEAHAFVVSSLASGCSTGNFLGFPQLPPGVTEIQRIAVNRTLAAEPQDSYAPPPSLHTGSLPGLVSVENVGNSDLVSNEEIISGTIFGAGDQIAVWVLVHTYNGRWYPQSFDPCKGVHTVVSQGIWSTKAIFGEESDLDTDNDLGKPFDVVVVLADSSANAFFDIRQREWCQAKHYPGLLTIELQHGISEGFRLRVIHE